MLFAAVLRSSERQPGRRHLSSSLVQLEQRHDDRQFGRQLRCLPVPRQQTGWEERLRNNPLCVDDKRKTSTRSVSQLCRLSVPRQQTGWEECLRSNPVSTTNGKHQLGQSVNFVVYCAVSRKFRADVVSMLRCRAAGTNATTSPPLLNGGLVVGPLCPPSPSRGGSVRGKIRQYRESLGGIGSKVHNYQQHQQEGEEDERL